MQLKRQIPNIITAGNLFFGCLAIFFALTGHLSWAPWCILISAILDFFDGFAARKLGVSGELGKQLDSLADMVTFGVAPGIILLILINVSITHNTVFSESKRIITENASLIDKESIRDNYLNDAPDLLVLNSIYNHSRAMHFNKGLEYADPSGVKEETPTWKAYLPFFGLLIAVFSMVRLAKFNLDTRQTTGFIGLATPANTIFFAGLVFIFQEFYSTPELPAWKEMIAHVVLDYRALILMAIVFSFLLIAEIPMFSLKVKGFGWKENQIRYIFLILCIALLIVLQLWAFPFIILTYILISVGLKILNKG